MDHGVKGGLSESTKCMVDFIYTLGYKEKCEWKIKG